jgi:hypothetical protein
MYNIQTGIPANQVFSLLVNSGRIYATCGSAQECPNKTMVDFIFTNCDATGHFEYTGDDKPGIYVCIDTVDVSKLNVTLLQPTFGIPTDVQHTIAERIINASMNTTNEVFKQYPLYLPASAVPYIPGPIVREFNQAGVAYIGKAVSCISLTYNRY